MPDIENLYIEKSEIRNSDNFAFVDDDYDQDNSGGNRRKVSYKKPELISIS